MSELRELYQELILDHNRNPRNFREIPDPSHEADGHNPLCGDKIHIYLKVNEERITDITFQGSGCAISQSSASLMTGFLKGKTVAEARELFADFHDLVTGSGGGAEKMAGMGKLAVFAGVQEFPARVKCASLAWHTMIAALEEKDHTAKTE